MATGVVARCSIVEMSLIFHFPLSVWVCASHIPSLLSRKCASCTWQENERFSWLSKYYDLELIRTGVLLWEVWLANATVGHCLSLALWIFLPGARHLPSSTFRGTTEGIAFWCKSTLKCLPQCSGWRIIFFPRWRYDKNQKGCSYLGCEDVWREVHQWSEAVIVRDYQR